MLNLVPWKGLSLSLIFLFSAACGQLPRKDMSQEAAYKTVIGRRVKLKEPVWSYGISDASPPGHQVERVFLSAHDLYQKRYILEKEQVKRGTIFEVLAVSETKIGILMYIEKRRRIDYIVRMADKAPANVPWSISSSDVVGPPDDGNLGLLPKFYEVIP